MWNLTPDFIQQVKEELKGRRAAIEARHAEELKSLESDLKEIETLERIAYAVAVKHLPEPQLAPDAREEESQRVVELEPQRPEAWEEELQSFAELEAEPTTAVTPEPAPGPESKGLARWRIRVDANSETEST